MDAIRLHSPVRALRPVAAEMTSGTGVPKENVKQLQAEVVAGLKPMAAGLIR